jgi:ABC-type glycerol-3-phosphate transport system permease component
MQDPQRQVAQVAMAALQTSANYQPQYGEMFAAATVITVPLIALALGLQRHYVRGMTTMGVT